MRYRPPRILLAFFLSFVVGISGCAAPLTNTTPNQPIELAVYAAASLTDAFQQIGKNFEKANPGVKVTFNFAGSQQLAAQLGQGAPADVFASANSAQMTVAVNANRVVKDTPMTFVTNRLVVITSPTSKIMVTTLQDLAQPGLKLVLASKAVPVGQYALDYLDKAVIDSAFGSEYKANVLKNVVSYEENVRSVLTKVAIGEGDAGIVYDSDVAANSTTHVGRVEIPDSLNSIATYPIAPISDSKHAELAKQFVEYIFTEDSRVILTRYGFSLPK
ncbi:MAG: molybdate ABC transporter substrate-binding protein [Roseiflexaceae bacterium]|nr:molybdate ABC transporter substrate-binding protein [Roseiflexaceae bacterium]